MAQAKWVICKSNHNFKWYTYQSLINPKISVNDAAVEYVKWEITRIYIAIISREKVICNLKSFLINDLKIKLYIDIAIKNWNSTLSSFEDIVCQFDCNVFFFTKLNIFKVFISHACECARWPHRQILKLVFFSTIRIYIKLEKNSSRLYWSN